MAWYQFDVHRVSGGTYTPQDEKAQAANNAALRWRLPNPDPCIHLGTLEGSGIYTPWVYTDDGWRVTSVEKYQSGAANVFLRRGEDNQPCMFWLYRPGDVIRGDPVYKLFALDVTILAVGIRMVREKIDPIEITDALRDAFATELNTVGRVFLPLQFVLSTASKIPGRYGVVVYEHYDSAVLYRRPE